MQDCAQTQTEMQMLTVSQARSTGAVWNEFWAWRSETWSTDSLLDLAVQRLGNGRGCEVALLVVSGNLEVGLYLC